jgi:hypothetical protein
VLHKKHKRGFQKGPSHGDLGIPRLCSRDTFYLVGSLCRGCHHCFKCFISASIVLSGALLWAIKPNLCTHMWGVHATPLPYSFVPYKGHKVSDVRISSSQMHLWIIFRTAPFPIPTLSKFRLWSGVRHGEGLGGKD